MMQGINLSELEKPAVNYMTTRVFFCEKYDFFQGISKKSQEFGLLCIHSYCQHIKELSTVKRIV